jgi:hypothetical protein
MEIEMNTDADTGLKRLRTVRNELVDIYNTVGYYGDIDFKDEKLLSHAIKLIDNFIRKQEDKDK